MPARIRSLYLCVTDMARAIAFYEAFLEQPPVTRDPVYSVFDVGGFRLGLFAFAEKGERHTYGNSCLPSIEFDNLDILKEKLAALPVAFPLTRIGPYWVAECIDSEGNHLEITARA